MTADEHLAPTSESEGASRIGEEMTQLVVGISLFILSVVALKIAASARGQASNVMKNEATATGIALALTTCISLGAGLAAGALFAVFG